MLLEADLVDEVRLFVFPVVLGSGERVFGEAAAANPLRLVKTEAIGENIVHLSYEVVRAA